MNEALRDAPQQRIANEMFFKERESHRAAPRMLDRPSATGAPGWPTSSSTGLPIPSYVLDDLYPVKSTWPTPYGPSQADVATTTPLDFGRNKLPAEQQASTAQSAVDTSPAVAMPSSTKNTSLPRVPLRSMSNNALLKAPRSEPRADPTALPCPPIAQRSAQEAQNSGRAVVATSRWKGVRRELATILGCGMDAAAPGWNEPRADRDDFDNAALLPSDSATERGGWANTAPQPSNPWWSGPQRRGGQSIWDTHIAGGAGVFSPAWDGLAAAEAVRQELAAIVTGEMDVAAPGRNGSLADRIDFDNAVLLACDCATARGVVAAAWDGFAAALYAAIADAKMDVAAPRWNGGVYGGVENGESRPTLARELGQPFMLFERAEDGAGATVAPWKDYPLVDPRARARGRLMDGVDGLFDGPKGDWLMDRIDDTALAIDSATDRRMVASGRALLGLDNRRMSVDDIDDILALVGKNENTWM